jgi:hypothetical protein
MELNQRLAICEYCKNRAMNPTIGSVCGLTMQKPDFEDICPDYDADKLEINRSNERASMAAEEASSGSSFKVSPWLVIGIILLILRLVLRMSRHY